VAVAVAVVEVVVAAGAADLGPVRVALRRNLALMASPALMLSPRRMPRSNLLLTPRRAVLVVEAVAREPRAADASARAPTSEQRKARLNGIPTN
jgi:hypothetical protein